MAKTPDVIKHSLLNILPEGHDKPLQQAFYNTAANLFVVLVCGAAVAVYYILEAFLSPLMWAVLCGTFLHPFKSRLTNLVLKWLEILRENNTPFVIGVILLPFQVVDVLSELILSLIKRHIMILVTFSFGLPLAYSVYHYGPVQQILLFVLNTLIFLYEFLGYFQMLWIWTIVAAYVIAVAFVWTPAYQPVLQHLSIPVWSLVILHASSWTGPFRVPLCIVLVILMVLGWVSVTKHDSKVWKVLSRSSSKEDIQPKSPLKHKAVESRSETDVQFATPFKRDKSLEMEISLKLTSYSPKEPEKDTDVPIKHQKTMSDHCFVALLWAVALTQIWQHLWILQLLPILVFVLAIKKLGVFMWSLDLVKNHVNSKVEKVKQDSRFELLCPVPFRGLYALAVRGDAKVSAAFEGCVHKIMSAVLVLLLIVGSIILAVCLLVQVHQESMHIVAITSNVVNSTFSPEFSQWLPDNETMQTTLDSMMGNAYQYGRVWLAGKVQNMLGQNGDSNVEEQILNMWDQVYDKIRNLPNSDNDTSSLALDGMPDITNVSAIWDMARRMKDFDLDIFSFLQENIGLLMSVMESVWVLVTRNVGLLINFLTAVFSILFSGSSVILNFLIAMVIFITTLFYLLANSGDTYLPVQWFSNLSPPDGISGNKFGQAVEEAVSSVFIASFKMAAFYGIYTWLTHTLLAIKIVFIPAALAAIFGSIPFLGTYWAALPAVLELWLVNGKTTMAIILLVAHILPTYVVDTAIYSDIKGGHPYLTGLAIAGGIYWLGLEGAIIGPIVLCCLIVAVNVYSTMLRPNGEAHV